MISALAITSLEVGLGQGRRQVALQLAHDGRALEQLARRRHRVEQLDRRAPRQLDQHAVGLGPRGAGPAPAGDQPGLAEEVALAGRGQARRRSRIAIVRELELDRAGDDAEQRVAEAVALEDHLAGKAHVDLAVEQELAQLQRRQALEQRDLAP